MSTSTVTQSFRLRASAEALKVLRASGSPKIPNADLLKHAVESGDEPHPRIVREVYDALREARATRTKVQTSPLQKISGIFSRKEASTVAIDDVVRRFEQAVVQTD